MKTRLLLFLAAIVAVSGGASAVSAAIVSEGPDGREWEDMTRMSAGREKTRAAFAPFPDEASALEILPWKSARQICLDSGSDWKFKWSKDPASRPRGFENPAYDVSGWESIKVPCSWQAYGANGKGSRSGRATCASRAWNRTTATNGRRWLRLCRLKPSRSRGPRF